MRILNCDTYDTSDTYFMDLRKVQKYNANEKIRQFNTLGTIHQLLICFELWNLLLEDSHIFNTD